MGDYKISVEEAVALSGGELNKDDVYSLIFNNKTTLVELFSREKL